MGSGASAEIKKKVLLGENGDKLAAHCIELFEDSDFPLHGALGFSEKEDYEVIGTGIANGESTLSNTMDPSLAARLERTSSVIWIRPSEFGTGCLYPAEHLIDPRPDDCIGEDPIYNMYCDHLKATFSALCMRPDYIKKMFIFYNPLVGCAGIRLWHNAKLEVVIIDDLIPCNRRTKFPLFARSNKNDCWIPLLCKAMAKLSGSYNNAFFLNNGGFGISSSRELLKDLTGEIIISIKLLHNIPSHIYSNALLNRFNSSMITMTCEQNNSNINNINNTNINNIDKHSFIIKEKNRINCYSVYGMTDKPCLELGMQSYNLKKTKNINLKALSGWMEDIDEEGADEFYNGDRPTIIKLAPEVIITSSSSSNSNNNQFLNNEGSAFSMPEESFFDGAIPFNTSSTSKIMETSIKEEKSQNRDDNKNTDDDDSYDVTGTEYTSDDEEYYSDDDKNKEILKSKEEPVKSEEHRWVSFNDFFHNTNTIHACILNHEKNNLQVTSIEGEWETSKGTAGGGIQLHTYRNNPMYRLKIPHPLPSSRSIRLLLNLSVPDLRHYGQEKYENYLDLKKDFHKGILTDDEYGDFQLYPSIGIGVCEDTPQLNKVVYRPTYENRRDCSVEIDLVEGIYSYVIIPSCFNSNIDSTYYITATIVSNGYDRSPCHLDRFFTWEKFEHVLKVNSSWIKRKSAYGKINQVNKKSSLNPCWLMKVPMPETKVLLKMCILLASHRINVEKNSLDITNFDVSECSIIRPKDKHRYLNTGIHLLTYEALSQLLYCNGQLKSYDVSGGILGRFAFTRDGPIVSRREDFSLSSKFSALYNVEINEKGEKFRNLVLMPTTQLSGEEGNFEMTVMTNVPVELIRIDHRSILKPAILDRDPGNTNTFDEIEDNMSWDVTLVDTVVTNKTLHTSLCPSGSILDTWEGSQNKPVISNIISVTSEKKKYSEDNLYDIGSFI
jgi:hypothetical protein